MAGIYIHIPFCKQACHYCDFHFSTSLKKKEPLLKALIQELELRKNEIENEIIETIYFGGGTPSILEVAELEQLIDGVYNLFEVSENPEITLEANPDDLDLETIQKLAKTRINRLSIGVQSFNSSDLKMMNRAHNGHEALESLINAKKYFNNISVDLIYGIPEMTNQQWLKNIQTVLDLDIPHISSYALTVEPKTALSTLIKKGLITAPEDGVAHEHFLLLIDQLKKAGFIHYELSNFSKLGYQSRNNSAYWLGKKYLGVGPSAHSFDGISRSWNVANNTIYIREITNAKLPIEREFLEKADRYNEYIMTGLRTIWGVDLKRIEVDFGKDYLEYLNHSSKKFIDDDLMQIQDTILTITDKGKFLSDGIAADLFWLNLE